VVGAMNRRTHDTVAYPAPGGGSQPRGVPMTPVPLVARCWAAFRGFLRRTSGALRATRGGWGCSARVAFRADSD
jgi:hypothetical protein